MRSVGVRGGVCPLLRSQQSSKRRWVAQRPLRGLFSPKGALDAVPTPRLRQIYLVGIPGKCSATCYSVAAPPPGARHGLGGPMHPRHPLHWQRERCDRGLWEGCSCDTPATHSELRNEPRQGCSYTVERDRGGCSVCPTKQIYCTDELLWGRPKTGIATRDSKCRSWSRANWVYRSMGCK